MRILISRFERLLNNDVSLPKHCYNKWFFNDVEIKCNCIEKCIYRKFTIPNWFDYSDAMYVKHKVSDKSKK